MYRYYLLVIFGAPGILALLAALIGELFWLYALLGAYGFTVLAFLIGALFAILVRLIPARCFDPLAAPFWVRKWERRFYVRLGIRHWKDRIPETGALLGYLSKKQVADRHDNAYLWDFMIETCYAETMHTVCVVVGYLILIPAWFLGSVYFLYLALPVAVIHGVLHFLPVPVQRYVRPFLLHAYLHNKAKAVKKSTEQEVATEKTPSPVV